MKRDELIYIDHILESIDCIQSWTAAGRESINDPKTHAAVLRKLQTLAESTRRLPENLKEEYPDVPWREIAAFRNVIVHDYLELNRGTIWEIVQERIPPLREQIARMQADVEGKRLE